VEVGSAVCLHVVAAQCGSNVCFMQATGVAAMQSKCTPCCTVAMLSCYMAGVKQASSMSVAVPAMKNANVAYNEEREVIDEGSLLLLLLAKSSPAQVMKYLIC